MKSSKKFITKNKKAYFDYEILDTFLAGIILTGPEIKSVRQGNINLKGGFIAIAENGVWMENVHIGKYKFSNIFNYNPLRRKQLLLKAREMEKLALQSRQKGITIIPLEVLIKNNFAKVSIGLCRGKKKYDKREVLKRRDQEKQIRQAVKRNL